MNHASRQYVALLERHLEPTYKMLTRLVAHCPDTLWGVADEHLPFWQHVYHAAFFVDFWLREDYSGAEFRSTIFDRELRVELDAPSPEQLSKTEMTTYLERIAAKLARLMGSLDDERLLAPIVARSTVTYGDALLGQIRHVQHHISLCNTLLRSHGAQPVGWLGYSEPDDEAEDTSPRPKE